VGVGQDENFQRRIHCLVFANGCSEGRASGISMRCVRSNNGVGSSRVI
jgi:hypothetical protein